MSGGGDEITLNLVVHLPNDGKTVKLTVQEMKCRMSLKENVQLNRSQFDAVFGKGLVDSCEITATRVNGGRSQFIFQDQKLVDNGILDGDEVHLFLHKRFGDKRIGECPLQQKGSLAESLQSPRKTCVENVEADFMLPGKEFKGLREAALRFVQIKVEAERVLKSRPKVPDGPIASLPDATFFPLEEATARFLVELKPVINSLADVVEKLNDQIEALGLDRHKKCQWAGEGSAVQAELEASELLRASAVMQQLLVVRDFFHSLMWFFSGPSSAIRPFEEVAGDPRLRLGLHEFERSTALHVRSFSRAAALVLATLLKKYPRLRQQIWKCTPFRWGLKSLICQEQSGVKEIQFEGLPFVLDLLSTLRGQRGPLPLKELHREAVEGLNSCVPPGWSEAQSQSFDLSRAFRISYWYAMRKEEVQESYAKGEFDDDFQFMPVHGRSRRNILAWLENLRVMQCFGMAEDVKRAERTAFAPAEATSDAISLYEDAMKADSPGIRPSRDKEADFGWICTARVKALEMSLSNAKVAKQVKKGREKVMRVLSTLNLEIESLKKDFFEKTFFNKRSLLTFLAILTLRLETSLSAAQKRALTLQTDQRSASQSALLDWLRVDRKTDKPFSVISQVPLSALSLFIEEEEVKARQILRTDAELGESERREAAQKLLGLSSADAENHEEGHASASAASSKDIPSTPDPAQYHHLSSQVTVVEADSQASKDRPHMPLKSCKEVRALYPLLCDYCGKECVKARSCTACTLAVYCSRDCQKADWGQKAKKGSGEEGGPDSVSTTPSLQNPCKGMHKRFCALLKERVLPILLSDAYTLPVSPSQAEPEKEITGGIDALIPEVGVRLGVREERLGAAVEGGG